MKKGLFIVFEGGEGSGKSTILEKIYNCDNVDDGKLLMLQQKAIFPKT